MSHSRKKKEKKDWAEDVRSCGDLTDKENEDVERGELERTM